MLKKMSIIGKYILVFFVIFLDYNVLGASIDADTIVFSIFVWWICEP